METTTRRPQQSFSSVPTNGSGRVAVQRETWLYGGRIRHAYGVPAPAHEKTFRVVKLYGGRIPHTYVA